MKWIKFEDKLPTYVKGEQVKILFDHPKWATFFVGLYNHDPDLALKGNIWVYSTITDKYVDWDSMLPTHYCITNRAKDQEDETKPTDIAGYPIDWKAKTVSVPQAFETDCSSVYKAIKDVAKDLGINIQLTI